MSADPYRYFRIEGRELVDELAAGLAGLAGNEPTAALVAALLRHAHTLKGAARVVGQAAIADRTHTLEGLLGTYRGSDAPVPAARLEDMVELVELIGDDLRALDEPAPVGEVATVAVAEIRPAMPRPRPTTAPPRPVPSTRFPSAPVPSTPVLSPPVPSIPVPSGPVQSAPVGPAPVGPGVRPAAEGAPEPSSEGRTARASLAEIDAVIDGVRETRTQIGVLRDCATQVARLREPAVSPHELIETVNSVQQALAACADRMNRELRQVHDVAERLRLVPVTSIVPDLEGAARDVAAAQGKRVHVEVAGAQLRLDAPVLAAVQGALRQIVRNAVAHGIERPGDRIAVGKPAGGRVRLEVARAGDQVVFSCSDDGRGVDLAAVRRELAAMAPAPAETDPASAPDRLSDHEVLDRLSRGGVSTADTLSEVSGRGIGLDLVHDTATRLGGRVAIRTVAGSGTTIDLTTPLSLSAQEVLMMDDDQTFAVPLAAVRRTVRVNATEVSAGLRSEALRLDGEDLPFVPLSAVVSGPGARTGPTEGDTRPGTSPPAWSVVVLAGRSGKVAVGVRRLVGTATVAIRPVPALAPVSSVISGLWVDVDARPQLVLDVDVLVEAALDRTVTGSAEAVPMAPILVVDDSLTTRKLEQSVLESAGYEVELAASAEEGLMMAARRPYALVLVDVEMPGMDGFGFIEQTRSRPELRHLPCILVTSRASEQDRQRGLDAGARAHIDKREFHQGTLLRRIAEVLGS